MVLILICISTLLTCKANVALSLLLLILSRPLAYVLVASLVHYDYGLKEVPGEAPR